MAHADWEKTDKPNCLVYDSNRKAPAGFAVRVPAIDRPAVSGGRAHPAKGDGWQLLLVYRGKHCPLCEKYLATLNGLPGDFKAANINVSAPAESPWVQCSPLPRRERVRKCVGSRALAGLVTARGQCQISKVVPVAMFCVISMTTLRLIMNDLEEICPMPKPLHDQARRAVDVRHDRTCDELGGLWCCTAWMLNFS